MDLSDRPGNAAVTCCHKQLSGLPAYWEMDFNSAFVCQAHSSEKENAMLHYAIVFLVIALIAAVFGFGGIAASAVGIAKILFFIFIVMAVIAFVMSLLKK